MTLVQFPHLADLDVVTLVRFHHPADLDAMIPVRFHRLVGTYAVLFRHLANAYVVIPVPFHRLADMDAVAPVLFRLYLVVAVAEGMLMTSKTYIYDTDGVDYCITVVSQRKSQLMIIIYTGHYFFRKLWNHFM